METSLPQCRTMRELAKVAGVSLNAVSLALKDHPSISAKVRRRIQKLATQTGYRPDSVVSTLMARLRTARKHRSAETIAFLSIHKSRRHWAKNIGYYYDGAAKRADELGFHLEPFVPLEDRLTLAKMGRILVARGIRGIIIPPLPHPMGHVSLNWKHFSVARLGYSVTEPAVHRSVHDHHGGMILALRELKKLGYRRPGFCTLEGQDKRVAHHWLSAYLMYFHVALKRPAPAPFFMKNWDAAELQKWITTTKPDVIISNMTRTFDLLESLSLSIPKTIGFVNLDLHPFHRNMAGIDQNPAEVGATAVDLITNQLIHNQLGLPLHPKTVKLDGVWRGGGTVRNLRSDPSAQ